MAGSFPTLSFGTTAMYPLTLKVTCLTRVQRSANAAEQRYAVRVPNVEINATFKNLKESDRASIEAFFDSQKGAFDSTWTWTLDGKTFTAMRFQEDTLIWEESLPSKWSTRIRAFGLYPAISSPPSTLPTLANGATTQRPWTKQRTFETSYTDMESGPRHAIALRGGGLTNFQTTPERPWDLKGLAITPAEAENFLKFFISKHGRFGSFSFQDPDTLVTYTNCRFGADDLEVQYIAQNQCAITVPIVKT